MESEHLYELEYRRMDKIKHHKKITAAERDQIAFWLAGKVAIREIARRLDRSPSSISDEIKRNKYQGNYVAIHAQAVTEDRWKKSRGRETLKDVETFAYVVGKIKDGWSPEQIAGRLEKEHGKKVICFETIYRFIYDPHNKDENYWEYLPRKQKKRKKKQGRSVHKSLIPDRVSIHNRPEDINDRSIFGHWEGDSIVGRNHIGGIRTEVERVSRYLQARTIPKVGAQQTIDAEIAIFSNLPTIARQSTTWDNGREHMQHQQLHTLGIDTYFADPYSSWQRGTNENTNGLIRRYLPKKTSFEQLTQVDLDDIVEEINNRPRKVLHYQTPKEVFDLYSSVRIQVRM